MTADRPLTPVQKRRAERQAAIGPNKEDQKLYLGQLTSEGMGAKLPSEYRPRGKQKTAKPNNRTFAARKRRQAERKNLNN